MSKNEEEANNPSHGGSEKRMLSSGDRTSFDNHQSSSASFPVWDYSISPPTPRIIFPHFQISSFPPIPNFVLIQAAAASALDHSVKPVKFAGRDWVFLFGTRVRAALVLDIFLTFLIFPFFLFFIFWVADSNFGRLNDLEGRSEGFDDTERALG